jgi:hypothetical protein
MKKKFKVMISAFIILSMSLCLTINSATAGNAEVEAFFAEVNAAGALFEETLASNPVSAAVTASTVMDKYKKLTAEDQLAFAQKIGLSGAEEVNNAVQKQFIDRAYETQWNIIVAEWSGLMEQKKYDEAQKYATAVGDFLKNNAASLPGISNDMLENYKKLSKVGIDSAAVHDEAAKIVAEVSGLYADKKYKETIEKVQQYKKKAADTPALNDALKKVLPDVTDIQKMCDDVLDTVVIDYTKDKIDQYVKLCGEGKMKEASKVSEEVSEFLKNNEAARAISDKHYGANSVMICEKVRIDTYFTENKDLKNAMEMYPDFKAAVDEYGKLSAAGDFIGAAKLASEWVKKCKEDPVYKGANEAGKGVLLEMCGLGVELALVTGIDKACELYTTAVAKGDMKLAKQYADAVAQALKDHPEYKDAINKRLGGDWEKIAQGASDNAGKEVQAQEAKIKVQADTLKQLTAIYNAEITANGTDSVLAKAVKNVIETFAAQNAQFIKEIETAANIKLDELFSGAVQTSAQPEGEGTVTTSNATTETVISQDSTTTQQAEPPATNTEGVPPVTNQTEGTNQGGGVFTTGSGN